MTDTGCFKINAKGVLMKYSGTERDVFIPAVIDGIAVKAIYREVFMDKNLTSVVIPEGVEKIYSRAFCNNKLTQIELPQSIKGISDWAFAVNQISEITIPENTEEIGLYAFRENKLTKVSLPASLKKIGEFAFMFSEKGFEIDVAKGILFRSEGREKPDGAEVYRKSEKLLIPEKINGITVNEIGERAFALCNLTSVVIPEGVKSIGFYAFSSNSLTSITIPKSVKSVASYAFRENLITEIVVPKNVKIYEDAFDNAFDIFYNNNKRKEGIYIYDRKNKTWCEKELK